MKVCFLGLGSMGSGVCRNLLNKGYALQVWNRSPEKAAKVAGWGAEALPRLRRLPAAPAW